MSDRTIIGAILAAFVIFILYNIFIPRSQIHRMSRPTEYFAEDDIRSKLNTFIKGLDIPGAIVSVRSKTYPSFLITYGYADVKNKIPMNPDFIFRIGSVTKTFVGIIIMQLYQEKLIDLDKPISTYVVGIPNGENITVRDIGLMRSGIFNYSEDKVVDPLLENSPQRNWLVSELFAAGITNQPYFAPGQNFKYSNTNTLILGLLIERITGNTLGQELEKRILKPLRMMHTQMETTPNLKRPYTHGYELKNNVLTDVTNNNPSWTWAAGGMSSTVTELETYVRTAFGSNFFMNTDTLNQFYDWKSNVTDPTYNLKFSYGFQISKLGSFIGHNGSISGYHTYILYDPNTDTSIVISSNMQFNKDKKTPSDEIGKYLVYLLEGVK